MDSAWWAWACACHAPDEQEQSAKQGNKTATPAASSAKADTATATDAPVKAEKLAKNKRKRDRTNHIETRAPVAAPEPVANTPAERQAQNEAAIQKLKDKFKAQKVDTRDDMT